MSVTTETKLVCPNCHDGDSLVEISQVEAEALIQEITRENGSVGGYVVDVTWDGSTEYNTDDEVVLGGKCQACDWEYRTKGDWKSALKAVAVMDEQEDDPHAGLGILPDQFFSGVFALCRIVSFEVDIDHDDSEMPVSISMSTDRQGEPQLRYFDGSGRTLGLAMQEVLDSVRRYYE